MNKEIEIYINDKGIACISLKDYNDTVETLEKEIERLNNIIKEVREYIEETHYYSDVINEEYLLKSELLEILDKE